MKTIFSKNHFLKGDKFLIIFKKTNGKCAYCGTLLGQDPKKKNYRTIDHINPEKSEKREHADNLFLCCISCNAKKGDKNLKDFRRHEARKIHFENSFNDKQIDFLKSKGFELKLPDFKFWFEKEIK